MDYIKNKTPDEVLASQPSQEQFDLYAERASRACLRMFYNRRLYTDPHPGNFLHMEDGQIGLIDFGAVRHVSDAEWAYIYRQEVAKRGSDDEVLAIAQESSEMTDEEIKKNPELVALLVEGFNYYLEPHRYDGQFDFGDPDYIRRGIDWMKRVAKQRRIKQKPINVFFHKQMFQGNALALKMGGRINVIRLIDEEIQATGWEF